MVERTIILPVRDNDGYSLRRLVAQVLSEILEIAGGYSTVKQSGVWADNGTVYHDDSLRVVTTVDEASDARIVERIPSWAGRLRQVCIYTHSTPVTADFVYAPPADTAINGAA